jgi:hypothetical protein
MDRKKFGKGNSIFVDKKKAADGLICGVSTEENGSIFSGRKRQRVIKVA